ncbi:cellulose synthase subunit BcsC-related outer membrane protein [Caulobacter sp.]|uniref:cellulose synthase subunit BcsC-related outer membrane protein n=1 Tax=Caulobacter sp. TaxID=78 RepID=UPI002B48D234|nr:cellulose synthase subunit BcsC-related outer membrane protein [Caulobacter sp.]HJV42709.1 cellulose synthase subunit BcsC-related outer membrane protein [Caulobacter sp.]
MRTTVCISLVSTLMASTAMAQVQPRLPTDKPAAAPLVPTTRAPTPKVVGQPAAQGGVVQALLNQAASQRKRGRKDLGAQALQRALRESPNNAQVLQRLAAYALEDGDVVAGERWTRQLRVATGPTDPRVAALEKELKARANAPIPAQSQDLAGAPPNQPARAEAKPAAPPDPGGVSRAAGFEALERKDLTAAERLFNQALRERSSDLDAAGGLGIIRLQQGRFSDAEELLRRASRGVGGDQRWGEALRSAQFFSTLARARAAYEAGRYAQAEQEARPLAAGQNPDRIEAQVLWGQAIAALGRPAEAEAAFRSALTAAPQRPEAISGLAQALADQGRYDEASQVAAALTGPTAGQTRAAIERARANELQRRGDTFGAGAALSAALTANPSNPWSRYDYARFLAEQGQEAEAQSLMAPLYQSSDPEALQAAALYSESRGRNEEAVGLLRRVPEAGRTRAVKDLVARVEALSAIEQARRWGAQGRTVDGVTLLRGYLGRTSPSFAVRGRIAETLLDLGDGYQATALALEAARQPPASFKPSEASGFLAVLAQTGQDAAAINLLNAAAQQTPQGEYRTLAALYSTRRADRQRLSGDFAAAFDTLSQGFTVAPRDPALLAALARLYDSGDLAQQAAQTYDVLLAINPNDNDALAGSARVAVRAGDYARADGLLRRAIALKPNDAELYYQLGQMEQARGRERAALKAFERAQSLLGRGQGLQPGAPIGVGGALGPNPFAARAIAQAVEAPTYGAPAYGVQPPAYGAAYGGPSPYGAAPALPQLPVPAQAQPSAYAAYGSAPSANTGYGAAVNSPQTAPGVGGGLSLPANSNVTALPAPSTYAAVPQTYAAPTYAAPNYGAPATLAPMPTPSPAYTPPRAYAASASRSQASATPDSAAPLPTKVSREIAALRQSTAPQIEGSASLRTRSGEEGASRLFEASTRVAASISPFGVGRLGVAINPIVISAGAPKEAATANLGTNPLVVAEATAAGNVIVLPSLDSRSQSGAGVSLFYDTGPISLDAGVTPMGFMRPNFTGGVTARVGLGEAQLRATVEQRPVTDSVLAYSGDRDPLTGVEWGGVVRRNVSLGGSANFGSAGAYVDGAYRKLTGHNVASNTGYEINAGAYFRPIDSNGDQLQIGLNANMQAYDKNLRFFSFGHGGYFSPQQFVSVALPVSYSKERERWRLKAGFSVGVQAYSEDSAPIFPNNPAAQQAIESYASGDSTILARYDSASKTGIGLTGLFSGEYKFPGGTAAGGELTADTFGIYNEYKFRFYLRRILTSQ